MAIYIYIKLLVEQVKPFLLPFRSKEENPRTRRKDHSFHQIDQRYTKLAHVYNECKINGASNGGW